MLLSLHLKATMMKVSDPIMFGHAVTRLLQGRLREARRDVRRARRRSRQRHRRRLREDPDAAGRTEGGDRGRPAGRLRDAAAAGDGRLEQGHHQPARAERRDHRRLDARGDPRSGQMWGPDGKLHDMKAMIPGPLLRRHLSGRHRRLPAARRLRRARPWAPCPTSG